MISVAVIGLVGILNLVLGLTAVIKSRRNTAAKYYFLITICTVLWIIPLLLLEYTPQDEYKLLFARFAFIGPTFLPVALYGFIAHFPKNTTIYSEPLHRIILIFGLIFLTIALTGNHFITQAITQNGYTIYEYGYQYTLYFIYLAGGIFGQLFWMYRKFKKSVGLDQLRIKYLLTGFVLSASGALVMNMVFPMLGFDSVALFGPISTLFLFYFTTQAIIYHRLFDIGTFVANLVETIALATFFYVIIFSVRTIQIQVLELSFYDPLNIFIDLVFAFLVASNIKTIIRLIAKIVGRLLITDKIQVEQIIKEFDKLRIKSLSLSDYLQKVEVIINSQLPKSKAKLEQSQDFTSGLNVLRFTREKLYIRQEILTSQQKAKFMKQWQIGILSRLSDEITLVFAEKDGQHAYTKQEIEAISYISQRLHVSIAERSLFEQTKNFNKILQKKVQQQTNKLMRANNKLKELDKAKSDFISMASHQLRTPISVIKGYLTMITNGDLGPISKEVTTSVERVIRNTDQLNNIVEDILNASRIEQGRLHINPAPTNLLQMTITAIQELSARAEEKNIQIKTDLPTKINNLILDQTKIFEAILNLIDNAISYTQQGSVSISLKETTEFITLSIQDTGIGIPKDKHDQIFKRFSRLDNAKQIRPDGTGIGLFIAKKIIEAHNGAIWFESEEHKGSTFYVEFPKKQLSVSSTKTTK
ncbi:MAG: ATP-binding protein [Candidatus Dojkabacteria bacterium]|nr:MAG: ATP-binding protein [Candidatus Dojkabacteria bacterium]